MTDNLKKAKAQLEGDVTCAVCKDDVLYISNERGVKPLVAWLERKVHFEGFSAADKVIGKATAFLYVLLGVKEVYANVISLPALSVFMKYGITVEYGVQAGSIVNRRGDGICPFESAVIDIDDPSLAFEVICQKMSEFQ